MSGDFVTQVGNMAYFGDEYNAQQNLFAGVSGGVFGAADGVLMHKAGSALIPGSPKFPDGISINDLMAKFDNIAILNLSDGLFSGNWQFAVSKLGNGDWQFFNTIEGVQAWILKANGQVNEVASSAASSFRASPRNFTCMECAEDVVKALKAKGVKGKIVTITSPHANIHSIVDKRFISTSGIHKGVMVDGLVYDNIHNGIPIKDWLADFGSRYGFFKPTFIDF